jgi:hypothetical protein
VRNSSLVKRFCAENVTGLKHSTEATDWQFFELLMVGERSVRDTRITERISVAYRSENAGMSSVKHVRNMFPVNLRFPTEG